MAEIDAEAGAGYVGSPVLSSDGGYLILQDGSTPTNQLEKIAPTVQVNVKHYGVKEDYTALADVSTSGTTLTKVGGDAFTSADVGKSIGFNWGFDLNANGHMPGGGSNPGPFPTPTVVADITARDALSPTHQDMVEVTDPSADVGVNLPADWTGKAFYLRVYTTWMWVNHKARHYTTIASITSDDVVELTDAPDIDVSNVTGFYATDNFTAVRTLINQFPGKKLQVFFPKEASGYYVAPQSGVYWNFTNENVELFSNGATIYIQSSPIAVSTFIWPAGKSNISIKGLKFVSWMDGISQDATYANFNNANLVVIRLGNSSGSAGSVNENYELKDLEFTNVGNPLTVKEQSSTALYYTKNINVDGVKVVNGVNPIFIQQADKVRFNNTDVDHEITGDGQHHFYISHGVSNMKVENTICRRGQGYNIQIQSAQTTLPIKSISFKNIQFEDMVFGFVFSGNVKGVSIQNFIATVDTSLGSGSEIVINVNSANSDRTVDGVVIDGGEISGGGWLYTDFDTGANGYNENVTLKNLKIFGNTSGIFHRYANLTVENCEFIADNTDNAILQEYGLSADKRVVFRNNTYRLTAGAGNAQGFRLLNGAAGGVFVQGNTLIQTGSWDSNARFFNLESGYGSWGAINDNTIENTTLITNDGSYDVTKNLKLYNNFLTDGAEPLASYGVVRRPYDLTGTAQTLNRTFQQRFTRTTNGSEVTITINADGSTPLTDMEAPFQKCGDGDIVFAFNGAITVDGVETSPGSGEYRQSIKGGVVWLKRTGANTWSIWGASLGVSGG